MFKKFEDWLHKLKLDAVERRRAKMWTPERQLEELRKVISMDSRWLANDNTAYELTERYSRILQSDWYKQPVEDISNFRDRIGLNPFTNRK